MKKIYISLLALAMAFAVVPSCEKEQPAPEEKPDTEQPDEKPAPEQPGDENPEDPEPEPQKPAVTWSVTVSVEGVADGLVSWSEGDNLTAWSVDAEGNYGYQDYSERDVPASEISGNTAKFTFTTLPQGGKTWLAYMSNTGYDGCSAMKIEFNHASAYTQPVAGELPGDMVKMISSEVALPVYEGTEDGTVELEAQMKIAGTILRNVVSSSTGLYDSEQVQSVQFSADNAYIAGASGSSAYAYNMLADGKYWMDNSGSAFGDECRLIWEDTSRSIRTVVTETSSVSEGKAVFMPAPPVHVGGYKVVVYTDLAFYTFDCSSEDFSFVDGQVMTLELDLEAENVKRIGHDEVRGDLMYEGGMPESVTVSHEAGTTGLGYWYARTKDKDAADYVTREGRDAENAPFYQNVRFEVVDDATGAEATWLTVAYRAGDTWWDAVVEANSEAVARTATVTAYFDDVDGYLIGDAYRTKILKVTQQAFSNVRKLDFWGAVGPLTIEASAGKTAWSYWVMTINGANAENWADEEIQRLYKSAQFRCYDYTDNVKGAEIDWLSVSYRTDSNGNISDTWWDVIAEENTSDLPRKALVECVFPAMENYEYPNGQDTYIKAEVVTQKAARSGDVVIEDGFSYVFGAWQNGHNGQYTVQFAKDQLDYEHWLAVFSDLKMDGKTPDVMGEGEVKALVMQMLGLDEAGYAAQPFRFRLEFGGAGESKLMISLKEANTTGQMLVYEGNIYEADGKTVINHYTVNHLP